MDSDSTHIKNALRIVSGRQQDNQNTPNRGGTMALPSARRSQSARFCKGLYHGSNLRSSTAPTTASTILMVVQSCSASWWKKQDGCGDISQRTAQRNSRPHAPGMAIKRHHHDGRREPQWGELGAKLRKLKREKGKDKRD